MRDLTKCPDCEVAPGVPHTIECVVAVCLFSGSQRLVHQHGDELLIAIEGLPVNSAGEHDCGEDVWTGEQHGDDVCREAGWWAVRPVPDAWVPCVAGTPGAVLDRNRLRTSAAWSPELRRWVRLDNLTTS